MALKNSCVLTDTLQVSLQWILAWNLHWLTLHWVNCEYWADQDWAANCCVTSGLLPKSTLWLRPTTLIIGWSNAVSESASWDHQWILATSLLCRQTQYLADLLIAALPAEPHLNWTLQPPRCTLQVGHHQELALQGSTEYINHFNWLAQCCTDGYTWISQTQHWTLNIGTIAACESAGITCEYQQPHCIDSRQPVKEDCSSTRKICNKILAWKVQCECQFTEHW